jgi:hypothetical protein
MLGGVEEIDCKAHIQPVIVGTGPTAEWQFYEEKTKAAVL